MLVACGRRLLEQSKLLQSTPQSLAAVVTSHVHTQHRNTTILCVRKGPDVVLAGDGMASSGGEVVKPNVKKLRQLRPDVIGGFAGATADAFTLFEKLEAKLDEHQGQLTRAAVELAKAWRTDKILRRLDASLVVADKKVSLQITGNGDVLEPHDGIIGIGSGGTYALAAARALAGVEGLDADEITRRSINIAADICLHTNHNFQFLALHDDAAKEAASKIAEGVTES